MFEYKESFAEQTTKKLNQQSYLNQEKSMETKYNMLSLDDNPPQIGVKRPIRSEFSLIGEGSDFWEDWTLKRTVTSDSRSPSWKYSIYDQRSREPSYL